MKKILVVFLLPLLALAQTHPQKKHAEKKIDYGNNKAAGKYYDIRGMKMYCEVYGSGEPLLMIHGNGGDISAFANQIPYFSKKYKVIVADSRDQGKSIDAKDSLSYEMMADDYSELLTKMGISSANVIGWSDGGINGLLLAIRHPEKVTKLAITGANLQPDTLSVHTDVVVSTANDLEKAKAKANRSAEDKHNIKLLALMVYQPHIPLSDLHKIVCPTLVIGGDHDLIKTEHALQISQNIKQSYLWILPNASHGTLIDYPAEFNNKVYSFFKTPYGKKFL